MKKFIELIESRNDQTQAINIDHIIKIYPYSDEVTVLELTSSGGEKNNVLAKGSFKDIAVKIMSK